MKSLKQKLLKLGSILIGLVFVYILFIPKPNYNIASWSDPIDRTVRIYQFSKYVMPDHYKFVSYMDSIGDKKHFVTFKNKKTGQEIFIFVLNEFPGVKFENITISDKKIGRSLEEYLQKIRGDTLFSLRYLVSLFVQKDMSGEPILEIRGLKNAEHSKIDTPSTSISLYDGNFESLAFYRKNNALLHRYPVPIFDANRKVNGTLAIINNKTTGQTIFAFGCLDEFKSYNREEFIQILQTLTFDKEPRALFGSIKK